MKKLLTILTLCFFSIAVKAQTSGKPVEAPQIPATLIMPDGSIVPSKSLDSIKKVFGGRDIMLSFLDDGVHVHPQKNKAEQLESEQGLNSHLNKTAPEFALKDINGRSYSMADLKGKVVVLNFWFTNCGGCIMEMPDLNVLKKSYTGKDVVFLAITFDDNVKVNTFLAKNKFDYTIIPNADKLCKDYGIYGYPTSIVIDKTGIVRFIDCSLNEHIKSDLTKSINELI